MQSRRINRLRRRLLGFTDSSAAWTRATALVILFLIACALQRVGPAWNSDINVEPDAPAHFVTGLMVHDYIQQHFPARPLQFAETYYAHYPKVAIGHWPPVFYILQAGWMLIFGASVHSDLLLMALLEALFACTLFEVVRREFKSVIAAGGAALLLLCVPLVQLYGSTVMADLPVALFGLWAVLCWGNYLDTGRIRSAVLFSFFAAAAILTKGNGYALVLVPPFTVLLGRRFELLKRPKLLLAGLPLALCLPWSFLTRHLIAPTMQNHLDAAFFFKALGYFLIETIKAPGWLVSFFALLGLISLSSALRRGSVKGAWIAMLALLPAVILFHAIVPAGLATRYLLAVMPTVVLLAVRGVTATAARLSIGRLSFEQRAGVLAVLIAVVFALTTFSLPHTMTTGYATAARFLIGNPELSRSIILVCSENDGEGPFIARLAELDGSRPNYVVLRASHLLAESDWNGNGYRLVKSSPAEVEQYLLSIPVGVVVIDRTKVRMPNLHQPLLERTLAAYPNHWRLAGVFPPDGEPRREDGGIAVYRMIGGDATPHRRVVLPAAGTIQRQIVFDPSVRPR